MPTDDKTSSADHAPLVELVRLQPVEAEVIAARLRAAGIEATLGVDSIYESVSFADGVPVLVSEADVPAATALLNEEPGQTR
jgi:hypothetical protein